MRSRRWPARGRTEAHCGSSRFRGYSRAAGTRGGRRGTAVLRGAGRVPGVSVGSAAPAAAREGHHSIAELNPSDSRGSNVVPGTGARPAPTRVSCWSTTWRVCFGARAGHPMAHNGALPPKVLMRECNSITWNQTWCGGAMVRPCPSQRILSGALKRADHEISPCDQPAAITMWPQKMPAGRRR